MFDKDFLENNVAMEISIMQENLNRIVQKIMSIITSALYGTFTTLGLQKCAWDRKEEANFMYRTLRPNLHKNLNQFIISCREPNL